MVVSTTAFLVAGRFGLAPTLKQQATSGLRLVDNGTKGLSTGDPAGIQLPSRPLAFQWQCSWALLVCIPEMLYKLAVLLRSAELTGSFVRRFHSC